MFIIDHWKGVLTFLFTIAFFIGFGASAIYQANPGYIFYPPIDPPVTVRIETPQNPDLMPLILAGLAEIDQYVPIKTTSAKKVDICLIIIDEDYIPGSKTDTSTDAGQAYIDQRLQNWTPTCRSENGIVIAGRANDITTVVIHEVLHCLGLPHSADPNDVMYPVVSGVTVLSADNLSRLRRIYH